MAASDFADLIIKKLKDSIGVDGESYNSSTPGIANQAIADGITEYLIKNTKIIVNYSGMTTSTPPAPYITGDVCEISGECAPPIGSTFEGWVKSLENNIVSGFLISTGDIVTPVSPSPSFIPGLQISQDDIKLEHENNLESPQRPVWTIICQKIIDWITSIVSPPFSSTTISPQSTGISTVTKIEIT